VRRVVGGLLGVVVGISATLVAPALGSDRSVDWATYGMDNQRTGFNPAENGLGPSAVSSIRQIWSTRLGATILTQPIVASGVVVQHPRRSVDLIYAATEHGLFAAMDANTGRVVWSRRLGYRHVSFCGDLPNHDFGITGTPVIDHSRDSIYTTGGDGRLYELDLATGRTKRRWVMTRDPSYENDYGALTLVNGILYVPYSGNCDTNPYHGFVAAFRVRDGRRIATWFPSGSLFGGSVWGYGGVSADPGGSIFVAVGNSQGSNEHAGYGEHVVRLTPGLRVVSANYPGLPKGDADFGATPLLFQRPGCPPELAVGNKYGSFFVYDRDRISSGPVQRIGLGGSPFGQNGLLGVTAYWPSTATVFVSNPLDRGRYRHGVVAFRVTGSCRLSFEWSATDGRNGDASSPTVAAGVVFFGNGYGHQALALDARTGRLLWDSGRAIRGSVYAGPTVVNGKVYVSSVGGYLYAFAPAPQTVSPPSISGKATQGRTLTESHGSWTNNPRSYSYQWEDCDSSGKSCAAIGGATRRKFTLASAEVGHAIRVEETATNASGSSSPTSSAATRVVSPLPPSSTAPPSISGTTTQGQILAESHGSWTNSPTSFTYQWQRCNATGANCSAIPGATTNSYTLAAADVGQTIRVQETASNGRPSTAPATSAPTAVVQPAPAPPTSP
jgi:outer membrane protein assembly factor BamB